MQFSESGSMDSNSHDESKEHQTTENKTNYDNVTSPVSSDVTRTNDVIYDTPRNTASSGAQNIPDAIQLELDDIAESNDDVVDITSLSRGTGNDLSDGDINVLLDEIANMS
jgi:hypothetical protein